MTMSCKPWLIMFALASAALVGGCGSGASGDDGLTKSDQQAASRLDDIAKASGGDWDKVPEADKKYLVNDIAQGSEQSAKMLLKGKAGKLTAAPGGKTGK